MSSIHRNCLNKILGYFFLNEIFCLITFAFLVKKKQTKKKTTKKPTSNVILDIFTEGVVCLMFCLLSLLFVFICLLHVYQMYILGHIGMSYTVISQNPCQHPYTT